LALQRFLIRRQRSDGCSEPDGYVKEKTRNDHIGHAFRGVRVLRARSRIIRLDPILLNPLITNNLVTAGAADIAWPFCAVPQDLSAKTCGGARRAGLRPYP